MRPLVRALAAGRLAVGVAIMLRPEQATSGWIGRSAGYGGTQVLAKAFGARDFALGAGALAALVSGRDARDWVLAGAFADTIDLYATLTGDDVPASGKVLVAALAGGAIAVSAGFLAAGEGEP